MQRGSHAIVMRVIPNARRSGATTTCRVVLKEIAGLKNGIVLVTGPTGSGKSTTLAAVIDLINETKAYHIVTIEDPIEFLHPHKNSTVHQRELHSDTPTSRSRCAPRSARRRRSYSSARCATARRSRSRSKPPRRDTSCSRRCTPSTREDVDRIIGVFPKNEEQAIRTRLAQSFRFIVSQRLIPRADGTGASLPSRF
jgi:twitching motility protein PilT